MIGACSVNPDNTPISKISPLRRKFCRGILTSFIRPSKRVHVHVYTCTCSTHLYADIYTVLRCIGYYSALYCFVLLVCRHEWRSVMSRFQREVKVIEEEANSFIDESFQSLRSAEGAFDMLHNFKHIRSREAINATMMKKFSEILSTFEKEVDSINDIFEESKKRPPISKTQPPVAGSISWARSLFQRIKQTVLRFQTMKELIDSEAGKAVSYIVYVPLCAFFLFSSTSEKYHICTYI